MPNTTTTASGEVSAANRIAAILFGGLVVFCSANSLAAGLNYEYDARGRLVRVSLSSGSVIAYEYDLAGNRSRTFLETVTDENNNGIPDDVDDFDGDGIPYSVEGGVDTDGDGFLDENDLDSDNDGLSDHAEAGPDGSSPIDSDGDGVPDFRQVSYQPLPGLEAWGLFLVVLLLGLTGVVRQNENLVFERSR